MYSHMYSLIGCLAGCERAQLVGTVSPDRACELASGECELTASPEAKLALTRWYPITAVCVCVCVCDT